MYVYWLYIFFSISWNNTFNDTDKLKRKAKDIDWDNEDQRELLIQREAMRDIKTQEAKVITN